MKNENKKEFVTPEIKVSRFDEEDVIATSYGNPYENVYEDLPYTEI